MNEARPLLRLSCIKLLGKRVHFTGRHLHDYGRDSGQPVTGEGRLLRMSERNGLCILVALDDKRELWVEPSSVEAREK